VQTAIEDLGAAEALHRGLGPVAEECEELKEKMRVLSARDKKCDRELCGRMLNQLQ
jgi:hypothetical protein